MGTFSGKSMESLQSELTKARESLRAFRFASAGSRTKNVREGRELRKNIARLLTEIRSRTLAESKKNK